MNLTLRDVLRRLAGQFAGDRNKTAEQWRPFQAALAKENPDLSKKIGGKPFKLAIAANTSGHAVANAFVPYLAKAVSDQQIEARIMLCDKLMTACELMTFSGTDLHTDAAVNAQATERFCDNCFLHNLPSYVVAGIPIDLMGSFVSANERRTFIERTQKLDLAEIYRCRERGIDLASIVRSGVLRYFGAGHVENTQEHLNVARHYLASALMAQLAVERWLDSFQPDAVIAHHGIYVPQGIVCQVAKAKGVRVVVWGPSYRKGTFMFSHDDTYHLTLIDEPTSTWRDMPWDESKRAQITSYLDDRAGISKNSSGDWSWVAKSGGAHQVPEGGIIQTLGLDPNKPTAVLLTNILFDANIFYQSNAYEYLLDWIVDTIEHFRGRPDAQLVIRVHPHEHQNTTVRQTIVGELDRLRIKLPSNVRLVKSEHKINTYALVRAAKTVLLYGTKTGVEIAHLGIPIIVAGEAWIRDKGLTIDITSRNEYLEMLGKFPDRLPTEFNDPESALKYAYHYFFRRMIPVQAFASDHGWPPKITEDAFQNLADDRGLTTIIDAIVHGKPFVYDP